MSEEGCVVRDSLEVNECAVAVQVAVSWGRGVSGQIA